MAFPVVASTSVSNGTSSGISVSLPSGTSAGDLLVLIAAFDGAVSETHDIFVVEAGWTRAALATAQGYVSGAVFWKVAAGSDAATVDISGNAAAEVGGVVAYRITGHGGQVECAQTDNYTATGEPTSAPNPPSLTPTWGAADTLWIAAASIDNASRTYTAGPAGYANPIEYDGAASSASVRTRSMTKAANSATEDPGAYTVSVTEQWVAFTIAIKPEGSGGGSAVSTTISATTAPAVATVTGSVAPASASGTISATTSPAIASVTGSAASTSNNIRLSLGIQTERGGYFAATGWRYTIFADDARTAVEQSGTVDTNAAGLAVIDINASPNWVQGDWVPVMMTQYNAALPAADRVIRTMFGFVQAQAQS